MEEAKVIRFLIRKIAFFRNLNFILDATEAVYHSMPNSTKLEREVYEQYIITKYGIENLRNIKNPMGGRMELYHNMIEGVIGKYGLPK